MRGSQAVWCLGTFSYHPYIILHFGFDYENETQFYVLVVFYCPSARLPMLHGQGDDLKISGVTTQKITFNKKDYKWYSGWHLDKNYSLKVITIK